MTEDNQTRIIDVRDVTTILVVEILKDEYGLSLGFATQFKKDQDNDDFIVSYFDYNNTVDICEYCAEYPEQCKCDKQYLRCSYSTLSEILNSFVDEEDFIIFVDDEIVFIHKPK